MGTEDAHNESDASLTESAKEEEEFDAEFAGLMKNEEPTNNKEIKSFEDDSSDDEDANKVADDSDDSSHTADTDDGQNKQKSDTTEDNSDDIIKQLNNTNKSLNGRVSASDKRVNELADTNKALQEQLTELQDKFKDFPETQSDEEDDTDAFNKLTDEYPDLAVPLKEALDHREKHLKHEIDELKQDIKKVSSNVKETQEQTNDVAFNKLLQEKVPEVNIADVVQSGELERWVDIQTPIMKKVYGEVAKYGTIEETTDLLQKFHNDRLKRKKSVKNNDDSNKLSSLTPPITESAVPIEQENRGSTSSGDKDDYNAGWDLPSRGI